MPSMQDAKDMPSMQDAKEWLLGIAAAVTLSVMPVMLPSVSAYSGGFYDDGLYDDDWYFDYYESQSTGKCEKADSSKEGRNQEQYEAGQLYEHADESGLFMEKKQDNSERDG